MPLYRWNPENLEPVPSTTFEAAHLHERADLQRLLRDQPDVLEEGLFIVAEEFSNWQDSGRSIDLLALDSRGNLVVIELKRTQTGDHSELQAIRYAAMVSNMTLEQVVDAHRDYLAKRGTDGDARVLILDHLEVTDEADAEIYTDRPRIILASAGFSTELTTSVLWLRDGGIDVCCIKLQLYRNGNGLILDTSQVIPLPEASEYMVRMREKSEEGRHHRSNGRGRVVTGIGDFVHTIEMAEEGVKRPLENVYQWAKGLEEDGLVSLVPKDNYLGIRPKSSKKEIVTMQNKPGDESIRLRPQHLGKSKDGIEKARGKQLPTDSFSISVSEISNGLLDALTDAYREANGLPPTTPPLDTAPGSPAPAE